MGKWLITIKIVRYALCKKGKDTGGHKIAVNLSKKLTGYSTIIVLAIVSSSVFVKRIPHSHVHFIAIFKTTPLMSKWLYKLPTKCGVGIVIEVLDAAEQ